jgi:tetratricopeptide (TPR) repeat protein
MWSRRSTEASPRLAVGAVPAAHPTLPWRLLGAIPALLALAACAGAPVKPPAAAPVAVPSPAAAKLSVPPAAAARFSQALAQLKAGQSAAAEGTLRGLASRYPHLITPSIDLGLLYRRDGRLPASAAALEQALRRDPRCALAWTELGVTERLRGRFAEARKDYARAIAADPRYAPAYLDRGVLLDLYLHEPAAALADFRHYQALAGAQRPVTLWMAELEHRIDAASANTAEARAGNTGRTGG